MDFASVFHGWDNEVPPSFWKWLTKILIWETSDNPSDCVKNLPQDKQDAFWIVYNRVQAIAKSRDFDETMELLPEHKKAKWLADYKAAGKDMKINQYYYEELEIRKIN